MAKINPTQMRRRYNDLRRRYFLEPGGRRVPLAGELRWVWAAEGSDALGATVFDEDGHPYELHLNRVLLDNLFTWERERVIAHEMTHMRLGPGVSCSARGPAPKWRREQARLTSLGFRWL